jgi:hypothetical protein
MGEYRVKVILMVLNATFNSISVISWWSVLVVEEAGVPGDNQRDLETTRENTRCTFIICK